jgi:3-oxoacyl-[acyl-carrier-protein] synthase III
LWLAPDDGLPPVYLSSIAYTFGSRVPIRDLSDAVVSNQLDTLHQQGIVHCRVASEPPVRLAAESALRTIREARLSSVDAAIYCCDSPSESPPTTQMWDFLQAIGASSTGAITVGGSGCANLATGLAVAGKLASTTSASSVLLVTTDRMEGATRYLPSGVTVLSDGAASCMVGLSPSGPGFRILAISSVTEADLDPTATQMQVAKVAMKGIKAATGQVLDAISAKPADCRYLITGNHGAAARAFLAMAGGFEPERGYAPHVADIGHCFAADTLISLATLVREQSLQYGDLLMLLNTSERSWTAIAIECSRPAGEGRSPSAVASPVLRESRTESQ